MMIQRFLNSLPRDIPDPPVILDVGSYTGEQACEFASQFPRAQIFAFEARPQSAESVRRTVAPFANIAVIEAAVHDFDGQTVFHVVNEVNPGASILFVGSGVNEVQPIQQIPLTVPALRLDTWAKRAGVDRFDLVWMDLQGAELLPYVAWGICSARSEPCNWRSPTANSTSVRSCGRKSGPSSKKQECTWSMSGRTSPATSAMPSSCADRCCATRLDSSAEMLPKIEMAETGSSRWNGGQCPPYGMCHLRLLG